MPLGDYACGAGPCGFDPIQTTDPRTSERAPSALWYDAASRDFLRDDAGRFLALHPIDQGVGLSLTVSRGQLKSAPNVGNRLDRVELGTSRVARQIEDAVADSFPLRVFLADGSVTTLGIEHDTSVRGRLAVIYYYHNNITGQTPDPVRYERG
jgi:hypothetical protein